jgi:hypothetical protein
MTNHNSPAAEIGINPKLAALAAKIDGAGLCGLRPD